MSPLGRLTKRALLCWAGDDLVPLLLGTARRLNGGYREPRLSRALLVTPASLAQRIVRAKAKIREASIPYEAPNAGVPEWLPERLDAVLQIVYLVFSEGYSAAPGVEVTRVERTGEAVRLGTLLTELQLGAVECASDCGW